MNSVLPAWAQWSWVISNYIITIGLLVQFGNHVVQRWRTRKQIQRGIDWDLVKRNR